MICGILVSNLGTRRTFAARMCRWKPCRLRMAYGRRVFRCISVCLQERCTHRQLHPLSATSLLAFATSIIKRVYWPHTLHGRFKQNAYEYLPSSAVLLKSLSAPDLYKMIRFEGRISRWPTLFSVRPQSPLVMFQNMRAQTRSGYGCCCFVILFCIHDACHFHEAPKSVVSLYIAPGSQGHCVTHSSFKSSSPCPSL